MPQLSGVHQVCHSDGHEHDAGDLLFVRGEPVDKLGDLVGRSLGDQRGAGGAQRLGDLVHGVERR